MAKVYRTELSPVSFLRRNAYVHPDKTAVVHGDRRYSYGEFALRVDRLAASLRAAGLAKHQRVAFLAPNIPPMLEAHFAVPAAGGVLVAINTRLSSSEIDYILQHSGARFLFVDRELQSQVANVDLSGIEVIEIHDTGAAGDPYETFIAAGPPEPGPNLLADEEEPISINYTSGTTGQPKGVVYTHRGAYLNALGEALEIGLAAASVFLWTLPMFHCNGWCFTWAVTAVGGTHVCLRQVDPARIWALFADENITHYNGAPTVHTMLLNSPDARCLDRPITATIAGAPPSPTLLGQLQPAAGKIKNVPDLQVAYLDQHRQQLDLDATAQDAVSEGSDQVIVNGKPKHIIGYLQDFMFTPQKSRSKVRVLSGGERNRLLLAKILLKPCDILVMDEPTNDLDIESLELLEEFLVNFNGTLLLVSHDRSLLNNAVTNCLVFNNNAKIENLIGGYDDAMAQLTPKTSCFLITLYFFARFR